MATIRDMMPAFGLLQPSTLAEALELANEHGPRAMVLAGGLDSMDWLKDRIKRPEVVIDLGGVGEMKGIRAAGAGFEIGALTTLTAVERHEGLRRGFSLLTDAARAVATPQIRNQGTLGGNLSQDSRCWYFRSGWPCWRAGGDRCFASSPQAMNREHCILGRDRCVTVNPSDTAPALIALGGRMVVRSRSREQVMEAQDYYQTPSVDITRMNVLAPDEILVSVQVPPDWAGARFYYEKVRDRGSWDFQLASVAAAMRVSAGRFEAARIAVNGVAPFPLRLEEVERLLEGAPVGEDTADRAGELAVQGARPLRQNEYKVALLRNLVRRAVRSAA